MTDDPQESICPSDGGPCVHECNKGVMSRQCDPVRPKQKPLTEVGQIVAWLRSQAADTVFSDDTGDTPRDDVAILIRQATRYNALHMAALAIENGEHLK